MTWKIKFYSEFLAEYEDYSLEVQKALAENLLFLAKVGPMLPRPKADTLKGSKHANMKELRFNADNGVWRVAFAFDPERQAIILVGGDKSNDKKFYNKLLTTADKRFSKHLAELAEEKKGD